MPPPEVRHPPTNPTRHSTAAPARATGRQPRRPLNRTPPAPPPAAPAPATPPPTNPSATPNSIGQLVWMIQSNPDAYGEKGSDLLKKLYELQHERIKHGDHHDHVTDRADKTIEDADKWMRQGKLDPNIVAHTKRLLTPLANQKHAGHDHHDDD